jgi:PadR family transcriptional regulator PadR
VRLCHAFDQPTGEAAVTDDVPLGSFEEQVMVAVVRTRDEAYGTNVRREIESATGRDVAVGAVYATLDRLEAKGLVASDQTGAGGTPRRRFTVTAVGARALVETRAMRERLWHGVDVRGLLALGGV